MDERPLTILLIEDDPEDARLVKRTLSKVEGLSCEVIHVECLKDGVERVAKEGIDLALVDLSLPDSTGVNSFKEMHHTAPTVPIIVLSGMNNRETAIELVQLGAQDFLVKGSVNPDLLIRSIRYAIERRKMQQMRDQFVSTITHELRTPLTNMKGIISNIGAGIAGEINPKLKDYLTRVAANIDRLTNIVNDLLDINKLAARKIVLKRESVEMRAVIQDVIEFFEERARIREIALVSKLPDQPVQFFVDEGRIRQVLINLIGNAVKFTPKGGRVTAGLATAGKEGILLVADTGGGIAPEHQSKIFDPFYQVEHESGGGEKGIGLGLAIVKEIVAVHGGKIEIDSELGKGSCFKVTLPNTREVLEERLTPVEERRKISSL